MEWALIIQIRWDFGYSFRFRSYKDHDVCIPHAKRID